MIKNRLNKTKKEQNRSSFMYRIKILLVTIILSLFSFGTYGQCNFAGWTDSGVTVTPTSTSQFTPNIQAGEYFLMNVTNGVNYTVRSCSAAWDTQLTLYDTSGNFIVYNDDSCGLRSEVSFTATFTGQVRVILTRFNCAATANVATIEYVGVVPININGGGVVTCSGQFTDSGGAGGNYSNNEGFTYTICPDQGGAVITTNFTAFNVEAGFDFLYVYDGIDTSNLIAVYDNSNIPNTITSTDATGCLTFVFTSDGSVTRSGWTADVSCSVPTTGLSINSVYVDESAGTATFTVTNTGAAVAGGFTVDFTTSDATASAGSDYTATSGILTFAGTLNESQTITVNITDDTLLEIDEQFNVTLSNLSTGSINLVNSIGTAVIGDNDLVVAADQPLVLVEQFNGYTDYVSTGNTLRANSNTVNTCTIVASSSNTLTSPMTAGATIEKAYLYWAHSGTIPDLEVTFEGNSVVAETVYGTLSNTFHSLRADVTNIVNSIPNPSANTYDFSDLTIDNTGSYCSGNVTLGGWSLVIFYSDPVLPAASINLYQGFAAEQNSSSSYPLSGFYANNITGAKATFLSWEGDSNLLGSERLSVTSQSGTTTTLTGDGGQTGNNPFNSTIYDNTVLPVVNNSATYGLDLDTYDISSFIATGDNIITANVQSGGDLIMPNIVIIKVPSNLIVGNVFEDVNYGGGPGRDLATSGGTPIENVTVELYDNSGVLVQTTTTDASGDYLFGGMASGSYSVRVVNASVRSTRTGGAACATCMPVQTYRRNYASSTFTDITNEVGGANPSGQDVAAGTLTGAQSIATVTIGNEGVVGLDFGFNFNTIVNTNDIGQGSLSQFIENANNLGNTGLDIVANSIFDPAAGEDTSIFMIPPTGDTLGRTADANYASGTFDIAQANANPLPSITAANTHIDGRTQTAYSGDSNAGTVGSGGTNVGVSATVLPAYNQPEIQVHRNGGDVFKVQADNTVIRNISVYSNNNAGVQVSSGNNVILAESLIGVNAQGVTSGNINYGVEITGGTLLVDGNYISSATDAGIFVNGGTSATIQNNHITLNGSGTCSDNITLQVGTNVLIQQNLIENAAAIGIDGISAENVTITENTIVNSGQNGGNCNGSIENSGVRIQGKNNTISSNIINNNGGVGVVITGGDNFGNLISQNSIYNNGTTADALGIDIDQAVAGNPVGDGVTLNDTGDADAGPNTSINFPIFKSVVLSGTTNLQVKGWARPGATIELFITDISEGTATAGDNQLGLTQDYGEGQTYIGTVIEGSGADLSSATSLYNDADGNTDNTNEFEFIIPLPSGVTQATLLTATATIGNSTSEFAPLYAVEAIADLSLKKTVDNASPNQGDNITFTLTISNAGPSAPSSIVTKDIIPTDFTYTHPNFSTTQGTVTFNAVTRALEWDLGTYVLDVGNTITLTYTVTVDTCGEFVNQAEIINSSMPDPDSTPNSGG